MAKLYGTSTTFSMIKNISSNNPWVTINNGYGSGSIYIDSNKVQQGIAGQVRYNGNDFQVNDGNLWTTLPASYATVETSQQAQEAFQWVVKKMAQEREVEELAKSNQAVASALEEYRAVMAIAEERLKVVVALVKEHA